MPFTHLAFAALFAIHTIDVLPAQTAPQGTRAAVDSTEHGWLNGTPRTSTPVLVAGPFTGELRVDVSYLHSFSRPRDHTLVGSSESGRVGEVQVQQFGIGGDFRWQHVRARVMTQFGMYSVMTPRNDASPARGQWNLADGYRYLSEAYGGYHWNRWEGVNLDAGIFMSYIGLFSYYNFDNWAYQPSYVSSNTPWFFNGLRLQVFPNKRLKIEPWLVNGWQSYGTFNEAPGVGIQLAYRPSERWSLVSNTYSGADWLGLPRRRRLHTDNSIQWRYRDGADGRWPRAALSLTIDGGCETGAGVSCSKRNAQQFTGWMLYHRSWHARSRVGVTIGGGAINNPGRYLVLMPPINGATAASGSPYFTTNPGDPFRAWDGSLTVDMMPDAWTTLRIEFVHREASVPYFAGPGGVTPPQGNTGTPASRIPGWAPDLRRTESRLLAALLIKL